MNDFDLRDLLLAGVRWELTDMPTAMAAAARAATVSNDDVPAPGAQSRTQTAIVPPIAPQQAVSVETAVAMAARPGNIDALLRMISEFNHPLRGGATNVVLPHIAQNPNGLVVVTDIPSGDDDECGRILSGAAGELFDKMLAAIGMSRERVSIVPMVFWRTPGGRTPTADELKLARPFMDRIMDFLHPKFILTLGTLAATEIIGATLPRAHGMTTVLANGATAMPIYHPNYLMLKPAAKRDAWNALQTVQNLLNSPDK